MGQIVSIVYKPANSPDPEAGYNRVPVEQTQLIAGHGIEGDVKGGTAGRHLNLMTAETLNQLAAEGFCVSPGELGEQLVIAGLDVDSLLIGARLQLGQDAIVEIVRPRTGCAKLERHQGKERQDAAGRLGMMADVVVGGKIAIGDAITILAPAQAALAL